MRDGLLMGELERLDGYQKNLDIRYYLVKSQSVRRGI